MMRREVGVKRGSRRGEETREGKRGPVVFVAAVQGRLEHIEGASQVHVKATPLASLKPNNNQCLFSSMHVH